MNRALGEYGEQIAKDYLKEKGYIFFDANYRTRVGEIDLIMQDRNDLVCIEVKTRKSLTYGYPEESITKKKLHRIKRAMYQYRQSHKEHKILQPRIDAVSIIYNYEVHKSIRTPEINHLKNIS